MDLSPCFAKRNRVIVVTKIGIYIDYLLSQENVQEL
jgi:hypothetical protein